jgi:tetratricopeptide (TPR) repeat protein
MRAGLPCALGLLAACATARVAPEAPPHAAPPALELPPEAVEARRADLDLVGRNDEELFALGQAAYQAGDHARAAAAFERVADLFPASRRHAAALFDAGLARMEREEWQLALDRFLRFAREYAGPDADDAQFRAATCHHRLGQLAEARLILDGLASRADLPPTERVRAFTERGVLELEAGEVDRAERSLQVALLLWSRAGEEERLDDEVLAKAHFWLGEVHRARFLALPLDLTGPEPEQARTLEAKSQELLLAQAQYLRAARRGSPGFGVAGVTRVGELYEELYSRLAEAPVPEGLDAEHAAAWRAELWRQIRVLVTKAVDAYQGALVAARARSVDNRFVESAERSLERMQRVLLAADPAAAAGPPPAR